MFERVSRAAERVASSVSRRDFLGRLGQGALAVAGLLAGGFVSPAAAAQSGGFRCCVYHCRRSGRICEFGGRFAQCVPAGTLCWPGNGCCRLVQERLRSTCNGC